MPDLAPAPASPSPAPSDAAASAPASAATSDVVPNQAVTAEAAPQQASEPAKPAHESYDWSAWDGRKFDDFPEEARPWAARVAEYHGARLLEASEKHKRTEKLLNDFLAAEDDPRLAEWKTKHEEATSKYTELESAHKELAASYDSILDDQVTSYRDQHKWLFDDANMAKSASEAIDAGWDWRVLHELVKLPAPARKVADEVFAKTKDATIAIRLAKAETPATPGPEAFVSGSGAPSTTSDVRTSPAVGGSFRERASRAVNLALAKRN